MSSRASSLAELGGSGDLVFAGDAVDRLLGLGRHGDQFRLAVALEIADRVHVVVSPDAAADHA